MMYAVRVRSTDLLTSTAAAAMSQSSLSLSVTRSAILHYANPSANIYQLPFILAVITLVVSGQLRKQLADNPIPGDALKRPSLRFTRRGI